jgi:hypothetical protein
LVRSKAWSDWLSRSLYDITILLDQYAPLSLGKMTTPIVFTMIAKSIQKLRQLA